MATPALHFALRELYSVTQFVKRNQIRSSQKVHTGIPISSTQLRRNSNEPKWLNGCWVSLGIGPGYYVLVLSHL